MNHSEIRILDEVLTPEQFAKVKAQAYASTYQTIHYGGLSFPGMAVIPPDISKVLGCLVGLTHDPILTYFRVGNSADEHTSFIHTDHGLGRLAMILYLNTSEADGTAFWTHRQTWKDSSVGETADERLLHQQDHLSAGAWIRYETVSMRENRLVIFPTSLYHSRFPFHPTFPDRRVLVTFFE